MTIRLLLAVIHLLALGIGLGAVWARFRALRGPVEAADIRRAATVDAWWGVAAGLWVTTGLWRLFGETEKSTGYYFENHFFLMKMGFFVLILLLEVRPIMTVGRWRRNLAAGAPIDTRSAGAIARISAVQAVLLIGMVSAAVAMARGFGSGTVGGN